MALSKACFWSCCGVYLHIKILPLGSSKAPVHTSGRSVSFAGRQLGRDGSLINLDYKTLYFVSRLVFIPLVTAIL